MPSKSIARKNMKRSNLRKRTNRRTRLNKRQNNRRRRLNKRQNTKRKRINTRKRINKKKYVGGEASSQWWLDALSVCRDSKNEYHILNNFKWNCYDYQFITHGSNLGVYYKSGEEYRANCGEGSNAGTGPPDKCLSLVYYCRGSESQVEACSGSETPLSLEYLPELNSKFRKRSLITTNTRFPNLNLKVENPSEEFKQLLGELPPYLRGKGITTILLIYEEPTVYSPRR